MLRLRSPTCMPSRAVAAGASTIFHVTLLVRPLLGSYSQGPLRYRNQGVPRVGMLTLSHTRRLWGKVFEKVPAVQGGFDASSLSAFLWAATTAGAPSVCGKPGSICS
jgi:hypothetical protein